MNLKKLKDTAETTISNIRENGQYPNENDLFDYKEKLNIGKEEDSIEIFMINFAKDIISFSNANGGILLLGIKEQNGIKSEVGLNKKDIEILSSVDTEQINAKFKKILQSNVAIDIQPFNIGSKNCFYILIEKNTSTLIPVSDQKKYKLNKGEIWYRVSSNNLHANQNTSNMDEFVRSKSNEKSKEFMEIWSKILPEMFDINPKEILLINPIKNQVYGFNAKNNSLSGSNIEIDKSETGVFNIILNAIHAGEIGKITTNKGKPIYKIVGEIKEAAPHIILTSLESEAKALSHYNFTNVQLKQVIYYLGWVSNAKFKVRNPETTEINGNEFIWIETTDHSKQTTKVFFSPKAIGEVVNIINNVSLHGDIFNKKLKPKN